MRLEQPWSPQWLFEAGHHVVDTGGAVLGANDVATTAGAIKWQPPPVRLPRVDDNVNVGSNADSQNRRLAGEVALAALWRRAATANSIGGVHGKTDIRPPKTCRGTPGEHVSRTRSFIASASGSRAIG